MMVSGLDLEVPLLNVTSSHYIDMMTWIVMWEAHEGYMWLISPFCFEYGLFNKGQISLKMK